MVAAAQMFTGDCQPYTEPTPWEVYFISYKIHCSAGNPPKKYKKITGTHIPTGISKVPYSRGECVPRTITTKKPRSMQGGLLTVAPRLVSTHGSQTSPAVQLNSLGGQAQTIWIVPFSTPLTSLFCKIPGHRKYTVYGK